MGRSLQRSCCRIAACMSTKAYSLCAETRAPCISCGLENLMGTETGHGDSDEGLTSQREDLLVLEGGDMSKGLVYVVEIKGVKL